MNETRQKELLNNTVSTVEEFVLHINSLIEGKDNKVTVDVMVLQMAASLLNLEKSLMLGFYQWGKVNAEALDELADRFKKVLEFKSDALKNTEEMNPPRPAGG